MKFLEICAEVLVPKFISAEVRLPGSSLEPFFILHDRKLTHNVELFLHMEFSKN